MCEERRNDNAECNELFGYLWLRKLIVPYFNRHNRNYCLGNTYSVCNSLLNVSLCCAVCVVTSWSPLYLILPAEFQSRCTDVISSNRWKHKAPCTKKCDVCEVRYWLQSRFRPSSAIQTKQVLFIFFHQNIPLFYAKFAPHIRDSLLRSIWPVPACTFLLTQVLLYLAQVDLSSLVCVPGGFSHPLLSRWNWIAIFFFLSLPRPSYQPRKEMAKMWNSYRYAAPESGHSMRHTILKSTLNLMNETGQFTDSFASRS